MPESGPADAVTARVLALLADGTPRSTGELAAALEADPAAIRACTARLSRGKRVVRVGTRHEPPAAGYWFPGRPVSHAVWALPERP